MGDFRSVASGLKPFFAYLGPHAPHYPAQPAPWYVDAFPEIKIPLTPNYNVSSPDKTQHIRQNPPFTPLVKCWEDQHFRDRWQTLLSVDDIVHDLYGLLEELGILSKTFVIYSSDHGCKVPCVRPSCPMPMPHAPCLPYAPCPGLRRFEPLGVVKGAHSAFPPPAALSPLSALQTSRASGGLAPRNSTLVGIFWPAPSSQFHLWRLLASPRMPVVCMES